MQLNKRESFVKKLLKKSSTFRHRSHNHRTSDLTTTLHFEILKPTQDYPGESIHICGSIPELGNGSIELAPRMRQLSSDSTGTLWSFDVIVPFQELEFSRKDIAMTFDGNPQGFFFTFNYVVKQIVGGRVMIERFEEIPKRGLTKEALTEDVASPSSSSSSHPRYLPQVKISNVWNQSGAPLAITSVPKGLDLSKGLDLHKEQSASKLEDPITAVLEDSRMKGKSASQSEAPSSPTLSRSSTPRTSQSSTPQISEIRAQSAFGPDALSQQFEARSSSFREDTLSPRSAKAARPTKSPSSNKLPGFKWYRTLTGRDLKRASKKKQEDEATLPGNLASALLSEDAKFDGVYSRSDLARARSDSAPGSPHILLTTTFEPSSPGKRKQRAEAEEEAVFEKRRREEDRKIVQRELDFATNCEHFRDDVPTAIPSETSMIPQAVIEQQPETPAEIVSHLDDLSSEFRSPSVSMKIPEAAKSSESIVNGELSEDVLLDRIGESVPLLASESGQLPEMDSFYDTEQVNEVPLPLISSSPMPSSDMERDIVEQPSATATASGVDPVLFGKWHRVGQELKKSTELEGWSNWLSSIKQNVATKTREAMDSVINTVTSPKMVARVPSSVAPAEFPDKEPIDFTFSSRRTPNEIILLEEQERAFRMSHGIDAVLSGRWRNLGVEMSKKISPASSFEFGSITSALSDVATDVIQSAKEVVEAVAQPAIPTIVEPTPIISAVASPSPVSIASPNPVVIASNEVKRKSVFEEEALNHGVIHRKVSVDATAAVEPKPQPAFTMPTPVGYHKTRQDFMPIIHSTSQTASDQDPAPMNPNNRFFGILGMLLFALMLFYIMSTYFPESLLAMGPSSSSTSMTTVSEKELIPNNQL